MMRSLVLVLTICCCARACADEEVAYFESKVRPLLIEHCYKCHSGEKTQGGLSLDSQGGWRKGGDSGPAIVPGQPTESLLIQAIRYSDPDSSMPPAGKLPDGAIAVLTEWVQRGATDPRVEQAKIGGMNADEARSWWAFQPIEAVAPPTVDTREAVPLHEIDRFIQAKLSVAGLQASPPADRRTFIRRATYDLTGLPPTADEVDDFEADSSIDAYEKLIDRLLRSPHYGERWGRHWLDLVRYADTAGENSDHPLPHAWRYRNWVIEAFNRDQPYAAFLREQIAGDILASEGPPEQYASRIIATGFLALARRFDHDSDKFMHLTHEDGIDTLGKVFLGLTWGCARCHDHKYDAISARDYYALYGILESTKFAFPGCEAKQQPRDLVPLTTPAEWNRTVQPYLDQLAELDLQIQAAAEAQVGHARQVQIALESARQVLSTGETPDGGDSPLESLPIKVDINVGEMLMLSITPLANHGADSTLVEWGITEVGGDERRWNATEDLVPELLSGNPHADRFGHAQTWWFFDTRNQPKLLPEAVSDLSGQSGLHVWRHGDTPSVFVNSSEVDVSVWTKLPPRSLFAHPSSNGNVAIGWLSPMTGKVQITGRVRDAHPGGPDGVGWVLERFATNVQANLAALATAAEQGRQLQRRRAEMVRQAPEQEVAFAVMEGTPADARMHLRGDPEKLGEVVPRRWLEVLGGQPISASTGSGRLDLANWIASPENPLTARVLVNRIWLYHFGKGLVTTPNDFGTRGTPPTHPELLDWLAARFIQSGWSIKALHRQIMLSATYQQASDPRDDALAADVNNDLYWRFDRRRLSAEELRDSLLVASRQLDLAVGGPHPIPPTETWSFTQHVPFAGVPETNQRSIYQIVVRNRRQPFMALFDGADPNATTPQRQVTTVPTQSLYFLNDPFFHGQAEHVARRLLAEAHDEARLNLLFRTAWQRLPTFGERKAAASFLEIYASAVGHTPEADRTLAAWSAWSRVLLASNEFLYLD